MTIEERVALTFNDPALTAKMLPSLRRTAGEANVREAQPSLGGEDFSYYQKEVPGLFIWLGIRTPGADPAPAPAADEWSAGTSACLRGVRVTRGERVVLDGVDVDVRAAAVAVVQGPSGSGQTTYGRP